MNYLNLTYRRKADLECGDDAARKADLAQADDWIAKATGARKANEAAKEKKLGGGVVNTVTAFTGSSQRSPSREAVLRSGIRQRDG